MNVGFSTKVWGEDGTTLPVGDAIEKEIGEHLMGEDGECPRGVGSRQATRMAEQLDLAGVVWRLAPLRTRLASSQIRRRGKEHEEARGGPNPMYLVERGGGRHYVPKFWDSFAHQLIGQY